MPGGLVNEGLSVLCNDRVGDGEVRVIVVGVEIVVDGGVVFWWSAGTAGD